MQGVASTLSANGFPYKDGGIVQNDCDYTNSPTHVYNAADQEMQLGRNQSRAMAWAMARLAQCILASPTSTPNWLLNKQYWIDVSTANQQAVDEWSRTYNTSHSGLTQYPNLQTLGMLGGSTEREYGLYMQYMGVAIGFMVNQAGQSNWLPWYTYVSKILTALSGGVGGWAPQWPSPYGLFVNAVSTDYDGNPAALTSFADAYTFMQNSGLLSNGAQRATGWSVPGLNNGMRSIYAQWVTSTAYHCNSWIYEVRGGPPTPAVAGNVASITISGSFSGSPVILSHTVTTGEVATMLSNTIDGLGPGGTTAQSPITAALTAAINANSTLSAAGIKSDYFNINPGTGSVAQSSNVEYGRLYIGYNSDGTSSQGGPVIGNVIVTGSFSGPGGVYIQPNGDGVAHGVAGANLFNRSLSYQCGASGTSSGGPSGQALQTIIVDGTCKWCFVPEFKSSPIVCGGGSLSPPPALAYGGAYGNVGQSIGYVWWTAGGLAPTQTAGIAGAAAGRANMLAAINNYLVTFPGTSIADWAFSIVP